jgi:hypothetical protein
LVEVSSPGRVRQPEHCVFGQNICFLWLEDMRLLAFSSINTWHRDW